MSAPLRRPYTVLYDGDCAFCTRWRDRMARRDRRGRIEWLSVHDPSVGARFPGLDREDAMRQMYVHAPDGTLFKGADGWRELFGVLDGLRWLAALGRLPGAAAVMRAVYRYIAARRYRLSCAGAACRLPGSGPGRSAAGPKTPSLLLLAAAALAAWSSGCAGGASDPGEARLKAIGDERAATLVGALLEAYGGYPAWHRHHNVEYTCRMDYYGGRARPQVSVRQVHRLGLGREERAYIEDLEGDAPQIVRLDGERVAVTRGGAPVADPAEAALPRAFARLARFTFLTPWILLDAGDRLEYRGVRTPSASGKVPAPDCDVLRLTFARDDQDERSDGWCDFYISRLSGLIERVSDFRAKDLTYRVSLWSDYRTLEGLRIATRRETRSSDAGGVVGPLEVVAEYADVLFDAPFGDETFQVPDPLAASAPRE
ncbi:MAG: hypothetical protein DMF50_13135 [Acidobacteria bacterium]|nr:MAG: hypothetical protein DMF50_13135 [Acidobacteriota bacterium]